MVATVAQGARPHRLGLSVLIAVLASATALPALALRGSEGPQRAGRRGVDSRIEAYVMPLGEAYHPRIASRSSGSVSVGTVTAGYLARAAEIPAEGPHHRFLDKVAPRNTRFTTDELRAQVLCAAAGVAQAHPGHVLHLGNFSRRAGGDLPWSVSHNNGRDADLAFYARRPNGTIATPSHLYHFGRDLLASDSPEPMVFDVAANWTLVKGLLLCPHARMQRIFVARWLRRVMLDFARASKEPEDLLQQAARLLHQPRRAAAHNDHLHLRVACTADDLAEGCVMAGRAPHSATGRHPAVRRRLPRLRRALRSSRAATRAGAAYLLGLYEDRAATARLVALLDDPAADVRIRAAAALRWLDADQTVALLGELLADEDSPRVASAWLDVLAELRAVEPIARCLHDTRTLRGPAGRRLTVRLRAASLLATSGSLAAAQLLVPLLTDANDDVRRAARTGLERITNRSTVDLVLAGSHNVVNLSPTPQEEVTLWHGFLASVPPGQTRAELVVAGFRLRGLEVEGHSRRDLTGYAVALGWPPPYRDNAADFIARTLRYRPEVGRGSYAMPAKFWRPWLMRRRLVNRVQLQHAMNEQGDVLTRVLTMGSSAPTTY